MSLYHKHRPQKFIDIVGQDHVTTTLMNALKMGQFGQAYLFAGPKGSGKTTTARLLAKALNCQARKLNPKNVEPCDKCQSCEEIKTGISLDVIEIDAASNRGIDEIRELRDKIRFAPTRSTYKVYIIDECHMLTKEAFNALLKTLEEPPAHAVFILATTELHKVPATILSRTQFFDFKKAKQEEILGLLQKIAKAENLKIEEDALKLISRLSFGAYRDAVSMLDQISSLAKTEKKVIELIEVQKILGQSTEEMIWRFVKAIAEKNREKCLKIIEQVYFEGKDLSNFISESVEIFRKIMILSSGVSLQFEASEEEIKWLKILSEKLKVEDLVLIIEKLIEASTKVKTAILGQLPLEMAIFELTRGQLENKSDPSRLACLDLIEPRRTRAEAEVQNPKHETHSTSSEQANPKDQNPKEENKIKTDTPKSEPIINSEKPIAEKVEVEKEEKLKTSLKSMSLEKLWPEVIKALRKHNHSMAALVSGAVISEVTDDKIKLLVKFKFHAEQICRTQNMHLIESEILKITGKSYKVECEIDPELKIKKPIDDEEKLISAAKEVFEVEE